MGKPKEKALNRLQREFSLTENDLKKSKSFLLFNGKWGEKRLHSFMDIMKERGMSSPKENLSAAGDLAAWYAGKVLDREHIQKAFDLLEEHNIKKTWENLKALSYAASLHRASEEDVRAVAEELKRIESNQK